MPRITSFTNDGLRFPVRDTGPEDGTPIVLLHGFPQNSSSWQPVAAVLNERGYRTLAPDQRGYTQDATPAGRGSYRIDRLAGDVVALIRAADLGPVHLVGHDWGAGVAWLVAAAHPELLRSLTAVSVPHPAAFLQSMRRSSQAVKSWYMLFFQLPWLPERVLRRHEEFCYRALRRIGQTPAGARRDLAMLRQGGTATAALNWYRALPYAMPLPAALRRPITVPTLQVWSDGDTAVGRKSHELSKRFVAAPWRLVTLTGSHWIPDEQPAELARLISEHAESAGSP